MGQNMIVRKMLPQEFDQTMILFGYYRDEAIESLPKIAEEYDENSVLETIRLYASNYEYCWFNMYEGNRPVGFVAGYASACPWNKKKLSANIAFIYVLKSHRNMERFKGLLDKFTEWAKTIDADEITGGDIGINPERTQALYENFGFKPLVMMSKELINE
jgi:GNAT superfamily N-acetyltransferase